MTYLFLQRILYALQQCKNFENRLRFDKVTESLQVDPFLRYSVDTKTRRCKKWQISGGGCYQKFHFRSRLQVESRLFWRQVESSRFSYKSSTSSRLQVILGSSGVGFADRSDSQVYIYTDKDTPCVYGVVPAYLQELCMSVEHVGGRTPLWSVQQLDVSSC